MKFQLRELYQTVLDSDLSDDNKIDLLIRLRKGRITDDYFLQGNIEYGFECCVRKENPDGKNEIEYTGFMPDRLIDIYKQDITTKKR